MKRYINYSRFHHVSDDEKTRSIDFLVYVMHSKPMLCLNEFDAQNKKEILEFVRNKVYPALFSIINPVFLP